MVGIFTAQILQMLRIWTLFLFGEPVVKNLPGCHFTKEKERLPCTSFTFESNIQQFKPCSMYVIQILTITLSDADL